MRAHLTAANQPIRARVWNRFTLATHKEGPKGRKGPPGVRDELGDELLTLGTQLLQHGPSLGSKSFLIDIQGLAGGAFPCEVGGVLDGRA